MKNQIINARTGCFRGWCLPLTEDLLLCHSSCVIYSKTKRHLTVKRSLKGRLHPSFRYQINGFSCSQLKTPGSRCQKAVPSTAAAPTGPAAPAGRLKANGPPGAGRAMSWGGGDPTPPPHLAPSISPPQQHHPSAAPARQPGTLPCSGVPPRCWWVPPKSVVPTWGCWRSHRVYPSPGTPPRTGTAAGTHQRQGAGPDSSGFSVPL